MSGSGGSGVRRGVLGKGGQGAPAEGGPGVGGSGVGGGGSPRRRHGHDFTTPSRLTAALGKKSVNWVVEPRPAPHPPTGSGSAGK